MKQLPSVLIAFVVCVLPMRVAGLAAEPQHTYEFGACEQQLMWRDKGKLAPQLAHLDAMKEAGAGWVRLSLIYPTNLDKNLFAILQHCNKLGIKVLMVIEQGRPQLYPAGTKRRPGSKPAGQPAWPSYRLSELDLEKAKSHLQKFFTELTARKIRVHAFELFNEINWFSFNGDLPLVKGGLMIDEKTDWDNPVFVQYRKGLNKVGRLTKTLHDLNEKFFKGEPDIVTAGLVAYDTINAKWMAKVSGSIVDQELTLRLLHGSHPKQKGATNWLQYVDGIGMHIYPATVDLSLKTALKEIAADLDPCRTVPGVGTDRPFWITECGYARDKCGNDEDRRYKQHTVFYNALDAYDRKDGAIEAVMHFCWSKEAMARHAVWDHGKFYRTADIFKVRAAEPSSRKGLAKTEPPNILIIVSDDQGYGDFGFTGNKLVKTPTLDRLSKQGAFYPHFMVAPACTPTRSSLLTGRNHLDTGVWGVGARGRVRRDETLLPEFFTPVGYQTWTFGKIDGGTAMMEMTPYDRGWDYFYRAPGATRSYQHQLPTGWGCELITTDAIRKIREAGDKPWMISMNYIIPHLPWHCPDSYAEPYRKQGYSEDLAQCYGSIKQMDDQIGRLLEALDKAGQAENTIVMFLSDNGPVDVIKNRETGVWTNSKNRRQRTKDWALRNPDRLIGRKGEVWDNGIRSPLLVRWLGKVKPGIRKHAIGVEDILPTLLDLAKIPKDTHPKHLPFAGKSFKGSLENAAFTDDRDIFRIALGGPGVPRGMIPDVKTLKYQSLHAILRSGAHKFHHLPGGHFRLYNMEKDPAEKHDLCKTMPDRTAAMAKRCQAQWEAIAKRNRTFPMRQLRINNADRPRKSWRLPVVQALRFEGKLQAHPFIGGVKGFRFPGDRVSYAIDVQKPLRVTFIVTGKGFDKCSPISLVVSGKRVVARSRSVNKIVFGPVMLPDGKVPIALTVPKDARAGTTMGEVLQLRLTAEN